MAGKPATQFYPGDWWRSVDLRKCCMSTQGIWFNLLLVMWDEKEQGKIVASRHEIISILGCKLKEFNRFLIDLRRHNFAELIEAENSNGDVTIINRRMYSAFIAREATKRRVIKHRQKKCNADVTDVENKECNANVTPPSSTSSSTSNISKDIYGNVTHKDVVVIPTYALKDFLDAGIVVGLTIAESEACFDYYKGEQFVFRSGRPIISAADACKRWRNNRPNFTKPDKKSKSVSEQVDKLKAEGRL